MNEQQNVLLSLLRFNLFGDKTVSHIDSQNIDWSQVYNEAIAHSVLPIVLAAADSFVTAKKDDDWHKRSYAVIANNVKNQKAHADLKGIINGKYVIIKGVASARYYPNPVLRSMGDIDFIVPEDELEKASEQLEQSGAVRTDSGDHDFHRHYEGKGFTWELHWAIPGIPNSGMPKERAEFYLSNLFDECVWDGDYCVPSDFHHGLILLLHTACHLTATGIGLRHLCDWAVFVNSFEETAFISLFKTPLEEMGLWMFAKVLTRVSIKYLGAKSQQWAYDGVDESVVDAIMNDIMDSGNFGNKDSQRMNQYKFYSNAETGQITDGNMTGSLFSALSARARIAMPIVNKVKILMPIGWIYVGVRHLFRIATGKRRKINVKQTLEGAQKRGAIYKELKLFETDCEA